MLVYRQNIKIQHLTLTKIAPNRQQFDEPIKTSAYISIMVP
jgi:hypothetical protein